MKKPKYKYRIYYTTKGKPFTMDVVVFKDNLKSALNRFYQAAFNFDEVTYAEKIGEVKEMNTLKKIDMFLLDESSYAIYGKEKSKKWKDIRDKILNAKNEAELQKIMKNITDLYKSKKLSLAEFKDLVDKIDQKAVKMGN